jgi:hypothetical protein
MKTYFTYDSIVYNGWITGFDDSDETYLLNTKKEFQLNNYELEPYRAKTQREIISLLKSKVPNLRVKKRKTDYKEYHVR